MTEAKRFERQVARKLWVKEVLDGSLVVTEGLEPNVLETSRGPAGRVSLLGVVVASEELPVASVSVDDGTGVIVVRSFDRSLPVSVGDVVHVIGRPRDYRGERYVAAEAVVRTDAAWAHYRKRELGAVQAREQPAPEEAPAAEPSDEETNAERIIRVIQELDSGDGADVDDIIEKSKIANAEAIVNQLLMHGDVFELRPGRIKVL